MKFDVLGLLAACSYALDCVEAELIKVTNNHSKRVAYMAVCTAEKNGYTGSKPAGSGIPTFSAIIYVLSSVVNKSSTARSIRKSVRYPIKVFLSPF